jgi:hypothetical protein
LLTRRDGLAHARAGLALFAVAAARALAAHPVHPGQPRLALRRVLARISRLQQTGAARRHLPRRAIAAARGRADLAFRSAVSHAAPRLASRILLTDRPCGALPAAEKAHRRQSVAARARRAPVRARRRH